MEVTDTAWFTELFEFTEMLMLHTGVPLPMGVIGVMSATKNVEQ